MGYSESPGLNYRAAYYYCRMIILLEVGWLANHSRLGFSEWI
jgi:hypothetical protein